MIRDGRVVLQVPPHGVNRGIGAKSSKNLKQFSNKFQIFTDPWGQGSKLGGSMVTRVYLEIEEKLEAVGAGQVISIEKERSLDWGKNECFYWEKNEANEWVSQQNVTMDGLEENLRLAQQLKEFFSNKKRSEGEFEVGELVYPKLQSFGQNSVSLCRNLKLSSRYYSPWNLQKIGRVAHELDLPKPSRNHPFVHVSLLHKSLDKDVLPFRELPETDKDGAFTIAPAAALNHCIIHRDSKENPNVLIRWLNSDDTAVTWEDLKVSYIYFSDFDPWGQGSFDGRSIVMNTNSDELKNVEIRKGLNKKMELGIEGGEGLAVKELLKKKMVIGFEGVDWKGIEKKSEVHHPRG